jgi:hypothetical protein
MRPQLDRIGYRPAQRLDRCDLEQSSRRAAELLDLHVARGHGVWGVASGLDCTLADSIVHVAPGVAVDMLGRQLVNASTREVPLPALPEPGAFAFDLVASVAPVEGDTCDSLGPRLERIALRWLFAGPATDPDTPPSRSSKVRLGLDVPLARLITDSGGVASAVDSTSRPVAHALARPKIASGQVLQSTTEVFGSYADWTMLVSTTSGGFLGSSPVYLVNLDAHPFGDTATLRPNDADSPPDLATRQRWPLFVAIESTWAQGFQLRVVTATDDNWATAAQPGTNPVPVSWIAIDTHDGAPLPMWFVMMQWGMIL